jgi:hypothetical protein
VTGALGVAQPGSLVLGGSGAGVSIAPEQVTQFGQILFPFAWGLAAQLPPGVHVRWLA